MGFFGPERPEELSRIATCTIVESGQKQRFYDPNSNGTMTVLFFRLLSADYRTKRKYSLYRAAFLYTTDLRTVSKSPALAVHSGTMLPKHFWNVIRNFRILSCRRSVLSFRLLAWHTIWVIRLSVIQAKRPFPLFSLKGKEFA